MRRRLRGMRSGLLCGLVLAGAMAAEAQTLVWSIRLETVGWVDPYKQTPPMTKQAPQRSASDNSVGIMESMARSVQYDPDLGVAYSQMLAIDPAGQVYFGFGVKGDGPDAAKTFHVVTLDGQHGAVVRRMAMPTPALDRTAVLLAGDGSLLVVAGDRVQQVKNDGTIGNSIPIPPQPDINPGLWVKQSPSGKTLLLTTDEKTFQFVRADTLATVAECRTENDEVDELNDNLGLSMEDTKGPYFELHLGPFCGQMRLLWTLSSGRSSSVHLLDDGTVLEVGSQVVRRLTSADKALWHWKAPGETVPEDKGGAAAISRNGGRMAVRLTGFRMLRSPGCMECTGPEFEDWNVAIVVLDLATGRQVASLPQEHNNESRLAFALSPNGKRLAVMRGGVLEMWAL